MKQNQKSQLLLEIFRLTGTNTIVKAAPCIKLHSATLRAINAHRKPVTKPLFSRLIALGVDPETILKHQIQYSKMPGTRPMLAKEELLDFRISARLLDALSSALYVEGKNQISVMDIVSVQHAIGHRKNITVKAIRRWMDR